MKRLLLFLLFFTAFFGGAALIAGCNTGGDDGGGEVVEEKLPYPMQVSASLDPNAFVILQWEEVPGAVDYKVWRSNVMNAPDENYVLRDSTGGATYYADEPWRGNNYYKIQAIGETATGEHVDGERNPVFDAQCAYSFDAPKNVFAYQQGKTVVISWSVVPGSGITYDVFRSTTAGGVYEWRGNRPSPVLTFVDSEPLLGYNYYRVQAKSSSLGVSDYSTPSNGLEYLNPESDKIFVGVVAFSNDVTDRKPITNNLESVRNTITGLTRGADATALCYAVSEGIKLFDNPDLPEFDNIYIVSFTDGFDNVSGGLYGSVAQALVFDEAQADLLYLSMYNNLISYAIGFGSDPNADDMKKLVMGIDPSDGYRKATDNDLGPVFTDVANSVLATAKNVYLETNFSNYTESYPKFFRINVEAKQKNISYPDFVIAKLVDNMFSVIKYGEYLTFDEPVEGIRIGNKIQIPLRNFKFTINGVNAIVEQKGVLVSTKPAGPEGYPILEDFRTDEEDRFPEATDVDKKIAVVLVLDCSSSLTTNTFSVVKTAANNFISTLARVK